MLFSSSGNNSIVCRKGAYHIISESQTAGGGMGHIYFATANSGQKVIVKSPKFSGNSKDAIMLQKLKIEARILSSLDHKNIVRYIDEKDQGQDFFLVIEYLDGKNLLAQYRDKPADEQTIKDYGEMIL